MIICVVKQWLALLAYSNKVPDLHLWNVQVYSGLFMQQVYILFILKVL